MKLLLTVIFTLSLINVQSQNYKLIDEKVKNYPHFDEIDNLVLFVNNSFDSDTDKVRAFYTWIAYNITYDLSEFYSLRAPKLDLVFDSKRINSSIEKQKIKNIAEQVFKERKALCIGFSYLFTQLCLNSNIEVKTIEGITKASVDDIENPRFSKNHSWNAVKIDNQWKLLDITYSSGYENTNTRKWVKAFNDFYFFTNPEKLLYTHLPAQAEFQLISEPLSIETFFKRPIFYVKYFKSGLQLSSYQKGILFVSEEDRKIRLVFKNKEHDGIIYYKFDNENRLKKLSLTENGIDNFVATLKYKSNKSSVLSLYYENGKIIDFKIEKKLIKNIQYPNNQ